MKQLRKEFDRKGFHFKQLRANGKAYVYSVMDPSDPDWPEWYEVFYHRENTQYDCVTYPSDERFGEWAWTYTTKQTVIPTAWAAALAKYEAISAPSEAK